MKCAHPDRNRRNGFGPSIVYREERCPLYGINVTLVNYRLEGAFAESCFGRVTQREDLPLDASLTREMTA
jgi:hypothetical protein